MEGHNSPYIRTLSSAEYIETFARDRDVNINIASRAYK
jgi:hypothetical protein